MKNDAVYRESALIWIKNNTTYVVDDTQPLPANIELFIDKYKDVMSLRAGVASEGISGLSQSFNLSDVGATLKQYAREIIGEQYVLSDVKVHPALDSWVY